jgi:hypothetical protein
MGRMMPGSSAVRFEKTLVYPSDGHDFSGRWIVLEPLPLAFAHGTGSSSLFSRASSPVRVFRRERDLLYRH